MQSLALGETEIQGQVRRGWELAEARGTASPELGRVVDAALHAGKRVRKALGVFDDPAEDGRAAGGPSLAEAAVLAELGRHRGTPTVLVLGAGEAATGALDGLVSRGVTDVTVLNRTLERAVALAASRGVSAAAWDRLATYLETADLVVSATAAPDAILGRDLLAQVAARRQGRPLTLLDIAVPRDVDPAARELPGLRLVDLDDLRREGLVARASRASDIPSGEAQLEREVARFLDQARSRASAGALSSLHQLGARIADEETARALEALDGLSEEDQAVVRALAQRVVKRLLYPASKELRGAESRPRNVELSA
jgi:glutamyl-tRNA reductase